MASGMPVKIAGPAGSYTVETALIRFDAAADMPADITSEANVTADYVKLASIPAGATRCQILWHPGVNSWNAAAGAGPIATGAIVAVGSVDDAAAIATLLYADATGGSTVSTYVEGRMVLSAQNPLIDLTFTAGELTYIHLIGIPIGVTPTNIVPSFVEIRFFTPV